MGVYVVTGGSSGIGAAAVETLRKDGHEVINVDLRNGDICANLATPEGRQTAIDGIYEKCPDGLDGIICNAGVSGNCGNLELVVSLNYFGTVKLARGVFDLLQKKNGSVVVTVSNTISQGTGRMDIVDLLNNVGDEQRIRNIVKNLDATNQTVGQAIYMATKYALARWVRRISTTWAARGVRVNAVAPGNVRTAMTDSLSDAAKFAVSALPIPVRYGSDALMDPEEIADSMKFLLSKQARGVNGIILFTDGGTDALLNSEKVY
ncbi:MAG: SDR family oxidoreductase [Lachnospiraceae bacterium]|nr:SDR family oxidoreductase [Lachnospiraceae bacterium]